MRKSAGLAILLLFASAVSALAHEPPAIYHIIRADEEKLVWDVTAKPELVRFWIDRPTDIFKHLDDFERGIARKKLPGLLTEWAKVVVDHIPVEPVVSDPVPLQFQDHGVQIKYERVTLTYGLKGRPRQIELTWLKYEAPMGWWISQVDAELSGFGDSAYPLFTREEPGFVWHVPTETEEEKEFVPPTVRVTPRTPIPIVTAICGLALLSLSWLTVRRRVPGRLGVPAIFTCVILGFLLLDVGQVSVVLPWAEKFERPTEQEAKDIFGSLHRNLYRGFDYETEDQVYDTLARSVRGDLLEQVYTQILETLIMRDQGGAVSKVVKVEIVDSLVTFPEDPAAPWYTIQCVWRVHGKVGHYGHTHVRVTEYRAQFKVTEEQGTWKIADMEILGQMRIDDGGLTVPSGGEKK